MVLSDRFSDIIRGMEQRYGKTLFLRIRHPVAYTQFVDDITVLTGFAAQLFPDVCHIYLKLFDTALIHTAPNGSDDGGVSHDLSCLMTEKGQNVEFDLGKMYKLT